MKALALATVAMACGGAPVPAPHPDHDHMQLSHAADQRMITVPAGNYIAGSTPEERATAYDDYAATANTDAAREHDWFANEEERHISQLPAFRIDLMPVTQVEYAEFIAAGQATAPTMDEATWAKQGFKQDFTTQVQRFTWKDGRPPVGREDHPVVLVTQAEAAKYCAWRGKRRLPTRDEYEKAARGEQGFAYPWGNTYEAGKLNSAVAGPGDTTPVGNYSDGVSPFGVLELAGNVFQWTATASETEKGEVMVKGSAWEDFGGVGRGASGHGRPPTSRHVIVGFRCAASVE